MANPKKFFNDNHDPNFTILAKEVQRAIAKNSVDGKKTNRELFEELVGAEREFHKTLLSYQISNEIYKRFIQLIRITNNNILSARPYFRETSGTFSGKITPALKARNPKPLRDFNINFHFIKFCREKWIGLWPKKLESLYRKVEHTRTILVEINMPLAINRAKIFFRKVPKNHCSFMDLCQASAIGIVSGVDKYTGSFKKNFVGVLIGRSTGNLIDLYSESMLHFYPGDRRILYRSNSIRGRQGIKDVVELTAAVNASFRQDLLEGRSAPRQVTPAELNFILSASSPLSSDSNVGEEGFGIYDYTEKEIDSHEEILGHSTEEILGRKQEINQMVYLASKLPIVNQKILRMKGIDF